MHYWITLNTNAVSHIRGVGVNWVLLKCIEIVISTDKGHFWLSILLQKYYKTKTFPK